MSRFQVPGLWFFVTNFNRSEVVWPEILWTVDIPKRKLPIRKIFQFQCEFCTDFQMLDFYPDIKYLGSVQGSKVQGSGLTANRRTAE